MDASFYEYSLRLHRFVDIGDRAMLSRRQRFLALLIVLSVWMLEMALGVIAYSPPSPFPADAPSTQFSAVRANEILNDLVGDGIPHPWRSKQNGVVRERILKYFREYGYKPEVQIYPNKTQNILVRRPGTKPGAEIILAGHYDSVPDGPGASDDGVAVAAFIEIARMLKDLPPTRNDIVFLITDGEETNLLGARAYVRDRRTKTPVRIVLNFEARGTSGPSLMFQTSEDDAWLIPLFARHATRPITSSLFTEVYKTLPNDTDFTIFKAFEMEGYNFAFVRDVRNYHTPRDNFQNVDRGSFQHHGDNAWRMLQVLADFDLAERRPGRVIYTDVVGQFVLWWPEWINSWLAGGILICTVVATAIAQRNGLLRAARWRVLIAIPLMILLALIASLPCAWIAGIPQLRASVTIDNGVAILVLYWAVALSMALGGIPFTPLGRVDTWSAWFGAWLYWNSLGFAAALRVPGLSYLFIIPGLVATVAALLAAISPKQYAGKALMAACIAGPMVAGLFWLPMQVLLYDGVGFMLPPVYPACAGLLALTVLPLVLAMPASQLDHATVVSTTHTAAKPDATAEPA